MVTLFFATFVVLTVIQQAKIASSVLNEDGVPDDQGNCDILKGYKIYCEIYLYICKARHTCLTH